MYIRALKIVLLGFVFIFMAHAQDNKLDPTYKAQVQDIYKTLHQLSACDWAYEEPIMAIPVVALAWHEYVQFGTRNWVKAGQEKLSEKIVQMYNHIQRYDRTSQKLFELYDKYMDHAKPQDLVTIESYRDRLKLTWNSMKKIWEETHPDLIMQAENHLSDNQKKIIQTFDERVNKIILISDERMSAITALKNLKSGIDAQLVKTLKEMDVRHRNLTAGFLFMTGVFYLMSDYISDRDHFGGLPYENVPLKSASDQQLHGLARSLVDKYGYEEAKISISIFKGMHNC